MNPAELRKRAGVLRLEAKEHLKDAVHAFSLEPFEEGGVSGAILDAFEALGRARALEDLADEGKVVPLARRRRRAMG